MASVQARKNSQGPYWRVKYSTRARQQAYETFTDQAKANEFAHLCNEFSAEHALMVLREKEGGGETPTFLEVAEEMVAGKTGVRIITRDLYPYNLADCEPLFHIPVGTIEATALRRWVDWMEHEKVRSTATMERVKKFACSVMREAMRLKYIDKNPITGVKIPKVLAGKRKHHVVTPGELEILCGAVKRDSDKALLITLWSVGPRIGEATALQVRHVHFNPVKKDMSGWLDIEQSWSKGGTGKKDVLVTGKTEAATRRAYFGPTVGKLLWKLVEGRKGTDWLFTSSTGTRVQQSSFNNNVWYPARAVLSGDERVRVVPEGLSKSGNKRRSYWKYVPTGDGPRPVLHDFRRSFITWSARAGVPIKVTAKQVGHANIAITADIYTEVENEDLAGGVAQIEAFLAQAPAEITGASSTDVAAIPTSQMVVQGQVVQPHDCELATWLAETHPDIYHEWVRLS